jgi:hypothetical protein
MSKLATVNRALTTLGGHVTLRVGTMWMAIGFACLAFVSLPAVIASHDLIAIVAWVTQSFLQLVLLPVIMVGQILQGAKTEARDIETHDAVMAEHAETQEILAALHVKVTTLGNADVIS